MYFVLLSPQMRRQLFFGEFTFKYFSLFVFTGETPENVCFKLVFFLANSIYTI